MLRGPTFASFRDRALDWLREDRVDWLVVAGLILLALVLRVFDLEHIPPGLHKDEASTGLDATRILHHGWIGPYVHTAIGQPAGPLYFAAPFVAVFGETVFAIRFAMAILGVATVGMTYVTFRIMFDRPLATLAAFLLCVSAWHIHYSRMAFLVISWPLIELVVLALFLMALRTNRLASYILCGLALGAGVYTYNAFLIFLLPFGLLVGWMALFRYRDNLRPYARNVGVMLACAGFAALPLIVYAADSSNGYFSHPHDVAITQTDEWKQGGFVDRADIVLHSARRVYAATFWRGSPDYSDGVGARAVVDRISLVLLGLGIVCSLWRWRQPTYVALLLMFALLPLASILTTDLGMFRRTFGVTPFLAVLEALPLAVLWSSTKPAPLVVRGASLAGIAAVLAVIAFVNIHFYFREFPNSVLGHFTYAEEMADASRFMRNQAGDPYVYFYDSRLGFNDAARLYLAPNREGEDRAREFSKTKTVIMNADRTKDVLFVFLNSYLDLADEVQQLYPGGVRHDEYYALYGGSALEFSTYYLPPLAPGATPAAGVAPVPTPTREVLAGGEERDRTRLADMQRIQQALIKYEQKYQEFPTNGGAIQTFCASKTADSGCRVSEFLDPLPRDPSGRQDQGYFYASNGITYRIFAYRESGVVPPCDEHPDELSNLVDLMCVRSP